MSSAPLLSFRNVGLSYRRRLSWFGDNQRLWALEDVSFDVLPGETLGVLGANGSGKSTLLRLMAGIIAPDRGQVVRRTTSVSLLSLQVGFVLDLSGRDNAILSGMLLGQSFAEMGKRVPAIASYAGLSDRIEDPLRTYSTGMRARLGFAVALAVDPEVLLIDEVLSVGDASFAKKSRRSIQERIASNRTAVLVTHSDDLLRSMCDRVVLLRKGRVVESGTPDQVLETYQNLDPIPTAADGL